MLGFRAVADRAELTPAAGEIAEARWLTREEMQAELASGALPSHRGCRSLAT